MNWLYVNVAYLFSVLNHVDPDAHIYALSNLAYGIGAAGLLFSIYL